MEKLEKLDKLLLDDGNFTQEDREFLVESYYTFLNSDESELDIMLLEDEMYSENMYGDEIYEDELFEYDC